MKGYVIDTFLKQSLLNLLVCLDEIQMPSFPGWPTLLHQSAVSVAKLNFQANIFHLQQSVEASNLLHKLATQAHELGLPCVICKLHLAKRKPCILFIFIILQR